VLAPRRIDLNDLVRRIADRHKLPARAKELELELILSGETLWSDHERLGTIVDNLLSNAIKFTAARSRVRIVTGRLKNDIYIEVRDEGKGIRPEDRENVFERFFQQPSAVNSRIRGSGLGLFIAREYARALGGFLQVINSDKGACLRLRLPRRRSDSAFEAVNTARTSSQSA
jgi:two-component system sensor histidine kinase GlrK